MRDRPARLDHQPRSLSPMPRHQRRLSLPLCHTSALPAEPRSRFPGVHKFRVTALDSREMPYKLEVRVTDARVPTGKGALSMERMFGPEDGATSSVSCPRRPFGEEQR